MNNKDNFLLRKQPDNPLVKRPVELIASDEPFIEAEDDLYPAISVIKNLLEKKLDPNEKIITLSTNLKREIKLKEIKAFNTVETTFEEFSKDIDNEVNLSNIVNDGPEGVSRYLADKKKLNSDIEKAQDFFDFYEENNLFIFDNLSFKMEVSEKNDENYVYIIFRKIDGKLILSFVSFRQGLRPILLSEVAFIKQNEKGHIVYLSYEEEKTKISVAFSLTISVLGQAINYYDYISKKVLNKNVEIKHISKKRTSKNNTVKKKPSAVHDKIYTLKELSNKVIYVDNKTVNKENIRKYVRHKESWKVTGHYRRYKSGKVIFVEPYTKGKKEETKGKKIKI